MFGRDLWIASLVCAAVLLVGVGTAKASAIGDPIDHQIFGPIAFHGPPGPGFDTFNGAGVPLQAVVCAPAPSLCPATPTIDDLVVDISTGLGPAGSVPFAITYEFGGGLGVSSPGAVATIMTHDLEIVGMPLVGGLSVYFWATPGNAVNAFGGPLASATTVHDLDSTGSGFDVGVTIADLGLLGNLDMYAIGFFNPFTGPGTGPPPNPPFGGMQLVGQIDIFPAPEPGSAVLLGLSLAALAALRRR